MQLSIIDVITKRVQFGASTPRANTDVCFINTMLLLLMNWQPVEKQTIFSRLTANRVFARETSNKQFVQNEECYRSLIILTALLLSSGFFFLIFLYLEQIFLKGCIHKTRFFPKNDANADSVELFRRQKSIRQFWWLLYTLSDVSISYSASHVEREFYAVVFYI